MAELMFTSTEEIIQGSSKINSFMNDYRIKYPRLSLNNSYSISIIRSVVTFLNEEKINYWVTNGTLLGLVRDGKFIDWDDDFDLDMNISSMKENSVKFINFCLSLGYIVKVKKNGLFMGINIFSQNVKISLGGNFFLGNNVYTYSDKYPLNYIEPIKNYYSISDLDLNFPYEPERLCEYIYVNWTYEIQSETENDFINQKIRNKYIVKIFFWLLKIFTEPYSYWFLTSIKNKIQNSTSI
jgi:hypothetical protein